MHKSVTQNKDDDAEMLAGVPASSLLRRPPPGADILEFQTARRLVGLEDAMEPDEGFEPLGSIAVRLIAEWKLPRIVCRSAAWEEEGAPTGAEGLPVRER
ncbi:hypothetical protein HJB80_02855 [Rhizobium lentis]|uniref:hypothetical protein n=1 Tax=Rhizobium lentis TaxID=1138194 RepID=UPI001C83F583|nr:hypothetical protein [Rhizobium lentis]MBX5131632.1 hypothetical protein [Rhizobium lentis]